MAEKVLAAAAPASSSKGKDFTQHQLCQQPYASSTKTLNSGCVSRLLWALGRDASKSGWRRAELAGVLVPQLLDDLSQCSGPEAVQALWGLTAMLHGDGEVVAAVLKHITHRFDLGVSELLALDDVLKLQRTLFGEQYAAAGIALPASMPSVLSQMLHNAALAAGLTGDGKAWRGSEDVPEEDAARVQAVLDRIEREQCVGEQHQHLPQQSELQLQVYELSEANAMGEVYAGMSQLEELRAVLAAVEAWHHESRPENARFAHFA